MNVGVTLHLMKAGECVLLLSAVLSVVGCASPGTPKPPSLHLPEVITDLTADRVGETVRLRWTTTSKTTDGLNIEGTLTAQLCRGTLPVPVVCFPMRRVTVHPGPSEVADILPAAVVRDAGTVLEYRIELLNAGERSAGLSSPVLAAGGTAPPAVAGLRGEATRAGVLLQWQPEDGTDDVELERLQISSAAKPGKRSVPAGPASQKPPSMQMHLRVNRAGVTNAESVADAGGTVDATAVRGESYSYTAQRVRRVVLAGHAFTLRSAVSSPVTVTARDVFPPQAPLGVEAIASNVKGVLGVDLSWTPSTEDDLAGYIVYRREESQGEYLRITPSPVLQPGFRDTSVAAGRTYVYTIRAVDQAGNLSPASAPANETTPLP